MRIGHYSVGLWEAGGVASYVRRVSNAQRKLGHELSFFNSGTQHPDEPPEWRATQVKGSTQLYRLAIEQRLDIVHLHTKVETLPPGSLPVIRTVHGHQPYCPSGAKFLAAKEAPCNRQFSTLGCIKSHLVDRCGSVRPHRMLDSFRRTYAELSTLPAIPTLAISNFIRDRLVDAGYPAERIEVLHLMGPTESGWKERPRQGVPRFVYLGRLTPQKGVGWLLKAVQKARTPIALDIAGDGRSMPALQELTRSLGIEHLVRFHGWVNGSRVAELLSAASAVVFPSIWHEPAGLVTFEAMSHGLPVIVSCVGGIPEAVVDGQTGLIVAPGDVDGLASAIDRMAQNPALRERLGSAGRATLQRQFTIDAHITKLMDQYAAAIASAGARRPGS